MSRMTALVTFHCAAVGPAPHPASPLAAVADRTVAAAIGAWEDAQPAKALAATLRLVAAANAGAGEIVGG